MLKRNHLSAALIAMTMLSSSAMAWAKPKIEIAITSSKEVVTKKGVQQFRKVVPAKKAAPGEILTYTVAYSNKGDEAATNVVIDDPVPAGASYVANSATGDGSEITFSNDGGRTYARPVMLFFNYRLPSSQKVERRVATPDQYTHVRWTVAKVAPGTSGQLTFQVKIK
jgi:uncharacterized repeat protein (TIGR01451 family)